MSWLSPNATEIAYLVAATCFILALKGLSSPRTARRGNLIGASGAVVALVTVFLSTDIHHLALILVAIVAGTALAVPAARNVKMTQMPQLVALFNGVGGGAAALVALLELHESQIGSDGWFSYLPGISEGPATPFTALLATAFTVLVGSVS